MLAALWPFNAWGLLYVPAGLNIRKSKIMPTDSVYVFCMDHFFLYFLSVLLVLSLFLFLLHSFLSLLHVQHFIFLILCSFFRLLMYRLSLCVSFSPFLFPSFSFFFFLFSVYSSFEHLLIAVPFWKRIEILTHRQVVCDSSRPPALPRHQVEFCLCLVFPCNEKRRQRFKREMLSLTNRLE